MVESKESRVIKQQLKEHIEEKYTDRLSRFKYSLAVITNVKAEGVTSLDKPLLTLVNKYTLSKADLMQYLSEIQQEFSVLHKAEDSMKDRFISEVKNTGKLVIGLPLIFLFTVGCISKLDTNIYLKISYILFLVAFFLLWKAQTDSKKQRVKENNKWQTM